MDERKIENCTPPYAAILGIRMPWRVDRVELKLSDGEVHVHLAHDPGLEWPCPECVKSCPATISRAPLAASRQLPVPNHPPRRAARRLFLSGSLGVEPGTQQILRNEPQCLAIDRHDRAAVDLAVKWNRQALMGTVRQGSLDFA